MIDTIVTTVRDTTFEIDAVGRALAEDLGVAFVVRGSLSVENLRHLYHANNIVVMTTTGPLVYTPDGEYYFHLSMAELRIKNLKNGKHDHMVDAMNLQQGESILDCTLGLASDAIVASYVVGHGGRIVGLEVSPIIAAVVKSGLQRHVSGSASIDEALRRITVINKDYNEYLLNLPKDSFDVVYFDPMFRRPIMQSSSMNPLRSLVDNRPITLEAISEARRIAKKRIVFKETRGSSEFTRLKVDTIIGGKYSRICYGIIQTGG